MKVYRTIREPRLGADWVLKRRRMLLAEMRPVLDGEHMGPVPGGAFRYDFMCDMNVGGHATIGVLGSAYAETDEAPETGEIVKVNGIQVRVLRSEQIAAYGDRYVRYEIEIERFKG